MDLSDRVRQIKPSPTLAVTARAAKLRAAGRDVIGLGAGEPDFDTPEHVKDAAIRAIHAGQTKYTAVGGTPSLRRAVCEKLRRENGLDYTTGQVLVSCGGKQSFFNLALALLNPGDEVIVPAPYWVSYPDIVAIAGARPVFIHAGIEQGFKITPAQLEAALTPKTRLFVINSPSNPSGAVYSREELAALGAVLQDHPGVLIATDDMYEHVLLADTPFVNILNACPDLYPRILVLNGVSKAYAMTGWRIGYAAGPEDLIGAMECVQSQSTSNPASISQAAAEAALGGDQSCILRMRQAFAERHHYVVEALNRLAGVHCLPSGGAFYAFPDFRGAIAALHASGRLAQADDVALSEYLLEAADVAVVPGTAFGLPGHLRLSFATSMANLQTAVARITRALA